MWLACPSGLGTTRGSVSSSIRAWNGEGRREQHDGGREPKGHLRKRDALELNGQLGNYSVLVVVERQRGGGSGGTRKGRR